MLFVVCFVVFLFLQPNRVIDAGRTDVARDLNGTVNATENEDNRHWCFRWGNCRRRQRTRKHVARVHEWSQLEFNFPNKEDRQSAIDTGEFLLGKITPIDIDVRYSKNGTTNVFVTIPRFLKGVPASLGVVTSKMYKGNPVIAAYPSWSWHKQIARCLPDRIVSVFRIKIDECGRLWVLDAGRLELEIICLPQILAFDLETNQLIHRYEFPEDLILSNSLFVSLSVDIRDPNSVCQEIFVYIADCQYFGLVVYDVQKRESWRVVDKTMYPYPNSGTFHIAGDSFDLMDGVFGTELSPYKPGHDRKLFYHALSSATENWVWTSYIRDRSHFHPVPNIDHDMFHTYSGRRSSQSGAQAMDKNGIMYFGQTTEISMNCWNTAKNFDNNHIGLLIQNNRTLQFASGVKVINNPQGEQELWFLTIRFQKPPSARLIREKSILEYKVPK